MSDDGSSGWRPRGSGPSLGASRQQLTEHRDHTTGREAVRRENIVERHRVSTDTRVSTGVRPVQYGRAPSLNRSPDVELQLPSLEPLTQSPAAQPVDGVFKDPSGDSGQLPSSRPFGDEPPVRTAADGLLSLDKEFQGAPSDEGRQPMNNPLEVEDAPRLEEPLPPPSVPKSNRGDDAFGVEPFDDLDEYANECRNSLVYLRGKRLADIDLSIEAAGEAGRDFPRSCDLAYGSLPIAEATPPSAPKEYLWTASGLCHKPLYFEQRHLERYGHTARYWTQPILSAAHFFSTLPVLPYRMGLRTPNECVYALGHYRPGNCAPYLIPAIPFTLRAGLMQAGAVTGAAALLP